MKTRKLLISSLTALTLLASGSAQAFFCKNFFGGSKRPPPPRPMMSYYPAPQLQYGYYYPAYAPQQSATASYSQLPAISGPPLGGRSRSCFFN